MYFESNNPEIMREISSRDCRTIRDCTHVIREHYHTVDDVESCWKDLYTSGWISTDGLFINIVPSKKHEWSKPT